MADGDNYLRFSQTVRALCNDARSGTLFVRTADRHASMVLFDQGRITGVYYGAAKGRQAIAMLRGSDDLTYHFEDGRPPAVRQDLASPAQTLEELAGDSAGGPPAGRTTPSGDTSTQRGEAGAQLGLDVLIGRLLAKQLAKYIGPAAQRVVGQSQRDTLAVASGEALRQTIRQLSVDLLEPGEQAPFERDAIGQIEAVLKGQVLDLMAREFVESLGPIGKGVFQAVISELGNAPKSPLEIERLAALLAAKMDDGHDRVDFARRVRRSLESLAS